MKIKIDWRKALKITADFFRPLVKPFVAALVGGGVVTGLSGCYVGKASFLGEDMRMYPFFGTAVAPAGEPAD